MTNARRRAIEHLADAVREQFEVKTPVDMEKVVLGLGGKLQASHFDDHTISGMIQKVGGSFEISYNEEHSELRSTFTIAHELGHLFLHMGYLIDEKKWNSIDEYKDSPKYRQGYSEEEYEANQFAGAFLMPESEYQQFVKDNSEDHKINIDLIAARFGVSRDAALTRGRWIGIFRW